MYKIYPHVNERYIVSNIKCMKHKKKHLKKEWTWLVGSWYQFFKVNLNFSKTYINMMNLCQNHLCKNYVNLNFAKTYVNHQFSRNKYVKVNLQKIMSISTKKKSNLKINSLKPMSTINSPKAYVDVNFAKKNVNFKLQKEYFKINSIKTLCQH